MIAKCLNVNRIRTKNFPKKRPFRTTVGLSVDMKYEFEAAWVQLKHTCKLR